MECVYHAIVGKHIFTYWLNLDLGHCVVLEFSSIHRHKDGRVTARLKVTARTALGARTTQTQLNLVSSRTRHEIAKHLKFLVEDFPWSEVIDNTCEQVLQAEEQSEPAKPLDVERDDLQIEYLLSPYILRGHVSLIFGAGGVGKTLLALHWAARLHAMGKRVLYCDWESDYNTTSYLMRHILNGDRLPTVPFYRRCILPLADDVTEIATEMARYNIDLIIIDSAGLACGGDIERAEFAIQFFGKLRLITQPTHASALVLTHVSKAVRSMENNKHATPIGSIYFENLARSCWELKIIDTKTQDADLVLGLFHRKANYQEKQDPRGYKISFTSNAILIADTQVEESTTENVMSEEILLALSGGARTVAELSTMTGLHPGSVRRLLSYLKRRGDVRNPSRGHWALTDERR